MFLILLSCGLLYPVGTGAQERQPTGSGIKQEQASDDSRGPGAMADIKASTLHFELAIGYRFAKTTGLKSNGADLLLDDGSKEKADWSGLMTRFGFSIPFDPRPYPAAGSSK